MDSFFSFSFWSVWLGVGQLYRSSQRASHDLPFACSDLDFCPCPSPAGSGSHLLLFLRLLEAATVDWMPSFSNSSYCYPPASPLACPGSFCAPGPGLGVSGSPSSLRLRLHNSWTRACVFRGTESASCSHTEGLRAGAELRVPEPLPWHSPRSGSRSQGAAGREREAGWMAGRPWLAQGAVFLWHRSLGAGTALCLPRLPLGPWQRSPEGALRRNGHVLWVGPGGREHPVLEELPPTLALQPAACHSVFFLLNIQYVQGLWVFVPSGQHLTGAGRKFGVELVAWGRQRDPPGLCADFPVSAD